MLWKRPWNGRELAERMQLNTFKEFWQDVFSKAYWKTFGPSLWIELKSTSRSLYTFLRRLCGWQLMLSSCFCAAAFTLLLLLSLSPVDLFMPNVSTKACRPDGNFLIGSDYSPWDVSGLFQITMGFGAFTFSNAKLLDAVWDVVSPLSIALYENRPTKELYRLLAVEDKQRWHLLPTGS
jgi:hypothetical protein